MQFSDKLNGYWEEGYHYYLEFRNEKLIVRNYRKSIALETTVSYDAMKIEVGEKTVISLSENVLSRDYQGGMMTEIKELYYENGSLFLLYNYTIMGETLYTLNKVEEGPFRNIIIHDEVLERIQGKWVEWMPQEYRGRFATELLINGNEVSARGYSEKVHCISYIYSPNKLLLISDDLINDTVCGYVSFTVEEEMLTAYMHVSDMSVPMTVFAREDMLDKITVPAAALEKPRSTMGAYDGGNSFNAANNGGMGMMGMMGMGMMANGAMNLNQANQMINESMMATMNRQNTAEGNKDNTDNMNNTPRFCGTCGAKANAGQKFCAECGMPIK